MLNKTKRITTPTLGSLMSYILLMAFSSATLANMCASPITSSNFDFTPNVNGVLLDKTLTMVNQFADIKGAIYDPVKQEMVFVGQGQIPIAEQIDFNDLVTVIKAIYLHKADPGMTFEREDLVNGQYDVTYFGGIQNTRFGKIAYESDLALKLLSMGLDSNGNFTNAYRNAVPTYKSFTQRVVELKQNGGYDIRFWFSPAEVKMTPDPSGKSFVFERVTMKAWADVLSASNNALVTAAAQGFVSDLTNNYDRYATVFPVLTQLKRLGKITALVKWLYEKNIPVDLSFVNRYTPPVIPTPQKVNMYRICANAALGELGESGLTRNLICNTLNAVDGGVIYDTANEYLTPTSLQALVDSAISTRPPNPATLNDLKWNFNGTINGTAANYTALTQTLAQARKDGAYRFTQTDLSLPTNNSEHPLVLTRYYDSFSQSGSDFGPGWSPQPYSLFFPEPRANFTYTPPRQSGISGIVRRSYSFNNVYKRFYVVDRVAGRKVEYQAVILPIPNSPAYKIVYASAVTNDLIVLDATDPSLLIYQVVNDAGLVVRKVVFKERGVEPTATYSTSINRRSVFRVHYTFSTNVGKNTQLYSDVVAVSNTNGGQVSYIYDYANRLVEIHVPGEEGLKAIKLEYIYDKISRAWTYTASGQLREATYAYNNGRLETVTRAGRSLRYSYDSPDPKTANITQVSDLTLNEVLSDVVPDIESRSRSQQAQGNPNLKVDQSYDRLNNTLVSTDSLQRSSSVARDSQYRTTSRTLQAPVNGLNQILSQQYQYGTNALAGPETVIDARNQATRYSYDNKGNITSATDAMGNKTSVDRYSSQGAAYLKVDGGVELQLVFYTDPLKRTSALGYETTTGRLKKIYRRVKITLDPTTGNISNSIEITGYNTQYDYHNNGEIAQISNDAAVLAAQYPWIAQNERQLHTIILASAATSYAELRQVTSAAGYLDTQHIDLLGRPIASQAAVALSPTRYDYVESGIAQDTLAKTTTPLGTTQFDTDVMNRKTSTTDSLGVRTTSYYNRNDQIERLVEVSPDGAQVLTTQYFYDDFGKLVRKVMANGTEVLYRYDGFDRVSQIEEIDSASTNSPPTVVSTASTELNIQSTSTYQYQLQATDANANPLQYVLVTGMPGMRLGAKTGLLTWSPTAAQVGKHIVVVQVLDGQGGVASQSFMINVTDVPLVVAKPTLTYGDTQIYACNSACYTYVLGVKTDVLGNVYLGGHAQGSVDFDLTAGTDIRTGLWYNFVSKYGANGDYLWTQILAQGNTAGARVYYSSLAVDAAGNVYIAGEVTGAIDMDPGVLNSNSNFTGASAYVYKLESNGTPLWWRVAEAGSGSYAKVGDITADKGGNVYLGGHYFASMDFGSLGVDFDPGPAKPELPDRGGYVWKLDSQGNYSWTYVIDGGGRMAVSARVKGLAINTRDEVNVTGDLVSYSAFDSGPGIAALVTLPMFSDVFIAALSDTGTHLWRHSIGGASRELSHGIALSPADDIYVVGNFESASIDFDPGVTTDVRSAAPGYKNLFLSKFNLAGDYQWTKTPVGNLSIQPSRLAVDAGGNLVILGVFANTVDFNPDPVGVHELTSVGDWNPYILSLDAMGVFRWVRSLGQSSGVMVLQGATYSAGTKTWTIGGYAYGTIDFDPSPAGIDQRYMPTTAGFISRYVTGP